MQKSACRLVQAAAVAVVLLGTAACGPARYLIVNEPKPATAPADGTARVYFVMPGSRLKATAVITEETKSIGYVQNGTWFWVDVPAGQHIFLSANGGNVSALDATVEAGKSYFVKIFVTPGFNANHVYMQGTCQADEDWANRQAWLDSWKQIKGNPEYMTAWDASKSDNMASYVAKVKGGEGDVKKMTAECGE